MLQVIQYYSESFKSEEDIGLSGCWHEMINSSTVLWILNLIKTNIVHKYLCCLCSLTLLSIVENHSIKIDVHEGAIKKNFSKVFLKMHLFSENQGKAEGQQNETNETQDIESVESNS